jgi:phage tail-like protein
MTERFPDTSAAVGEGWQPGRRLVEGLPSVYPIGPMLPALFHQDEFAQRFVAGLDDVMAPIFCTLDNLAAYIDPELAPPDFLDWLTKWLRVTVEAGWSVERQRRLVSQAVELYRWRSTVKGLRKMVAVYTGAHPEISESGAVGSSGIPGGSMPGSRRPFLKVKVRLNRPSELEIRHLDALIRASKPAHVPHTLEVVRA